MTTLLERNAELAALERAAAQAAAGHGRVAVVAGEAGIGKTTLVRRFLHDVGDARVLVGTCDDLLTPRTLGPLRDAVRGTPGPLAAALASGEREAVMDALLEELSDPLRVTVLVVEDVHWADDATLDVLRFLARRMASLSALVVLTFRDDEVDPSHPLQSVLGALAGQPGPRLQLHRLSQTAIATLVGHTGLDPIAVASATRGNPFFVTEVAAASGTDLAVPATVVDAVLARVGMLSASARQACEQLSVVPGVVPQVLVRAVLDDPVGEVAEAEARGVLEVDAEHVAFRHELARRAIETALPGARRLELHRRVLVALLAIDPVDTARVVHHAVEAGDVDQVVAHGPAAAREAMAAGAHRQAKAHLERLVALLDRFPPAEQASLLEDHAMELYVLGYGVEPLVPQLRAVEIRRSLGDPMALGHSLIWASRMHWWAADRSGAERCAAEAEQVLSTVGEASAELAMALSTRSQLAMLAYDHDEAVAFGRRAAAMAREVGDDAILSHALLNVGSSLTRATDHPEGLALMDESLRLAKASGDDGNACRAYANQTWRLVDLHRYDEARCLLDEAIAFADRQEQVGFAYYLRSTLARVDFMQGHLDEAERACRQILAGAAASGRVTLLPTRLLLGRVLVRQGHDDGLGWIESVREAASSSGELQRIGPVAAALAEHAWLDGLPVPPELEQAHALAIAKGFEPLVRELGYWRFRLGAEVTLEGDHPWALQVAGRWAQAARAWEHLGCPYEQALALHQSDEPARLVEALAILDELGAVPAATRVRRRLRELGARSIPRGPSAATRANVAGLTPRQVEVLDLVVEGLTNAEIAERLVVSIRTVDHHVSAILQKLGVSSRTDVAEAVTAVGDPTHP